MGWWRLPCAENIDGRTLDIGTGILTPLIEVVDEIWSLTQAQGSTVGRHASLQTW